MGDSKEREGKVGGKKKERGGRGRGKGGKGKGGEVKEGEKEVRKRGGREEKKRSWRFAEVCCSGRPLS